MWLGQKPGQHGRQPAFVAHHVNVAAGPGQPTCFNGCQAANNDYNGTGVKSLGPANTLSALGRGGVGNTAGVDHYQFGGLAVSLDRPQAQRTKQLNNLLAFVLIDLASECYYGKRFHNML